MQTKLSIYQGTFSLGIDEFSKREVFIDGWKSDSVIGIFDSYSSALAATMDLWEEYCDFHRKNFNPALIKGLNREK